jgi:hypothetical protein
MGNRDEEIKPCPSGCNPKQFIRICNIENRDYFIQCSCGWSTAHYMTKESAIKAWNTRSPTSTEPTCQDLISPRFNAVWNAIKGWDIQRKDGEGYAGATGTDVMTILNSLAKTDNRPLERLDAVWIYRNF